MKILLMILVVNSLLAVPIPSSCAETVKEREAEEQEFQKIKANPKRIVSVTQAALGALGYGTGPFDGNFDRKTADAIRRYQLARNLQETGDLDVSTMKMAAEDFSEYHKSFPNLPNLHVFTDYWESGYLSARGTWIIEGDRQAHPLQTTEIHCYRDRRQCI